MQDIDNLVAHINRINDIILSTLNWLLCDLSVYLSYLSYLILLDVGSSPISSRTKFFFFFLISFLKGLSVTNQSISWTSSTMHQPYMMLRSPGLRSPFYFQQYEADTCDPIALQAACLISMCFDPVTRLPPETTIWRFSLYCSRCRAWWTPVAWQKRTFKAFSFFKCTITGMKCLTCAPMYACMLAPCCQ